MTTTPAATAIVSRIGGALTVDSLVDVNCPPPASPSGHDILVEVEAISVNPVDVKVRASAHGSSADRILGWDAAGTVVAVGPETTLFAPGDEVYYAGSIERPGSYSRFQAVDERIVGRKPRTLPFAEAAALPLTAITAWEALFHKLKLSEDSAGTILVLGASGGVGSILIQLVKTLTQLRVIATASHDRSRTWVRDLGADVVVDHTAPHLDRQILAHAPGGVDYVFSAHSRDQIPLLITVVRPFGEIVAIDDERNLNFYALKDRSISWHWESMFTRSSHHWDLEGQHRLLNQIADLIDAGTLRTTLTTLLTPLDAERVRAAHRLVETGRTVGKIVVARSH
ncbi:zinc-binding alcohol dehydrogenase family protein [Mycetocola sp. JXN-3]|uniref:zinc-binding alcohol dehydrogenase family protein n=1 Tax=Mycetocola sp. JXN-3 TaxID=2116510 RepID=UPI00165D0FFE|nr:zinc-binding alcohol dehydrogenase family protein [Mycetocola sp. JXN-3]